MSQGLLQNELHFDVRKNLLSLTLKWQEKNIQDGYLRQKLSRWPHVWQTVHIQKLYCTIQAKGLMRGHAFPFSVWSRWHSLYTCIWTEEKLETVCSICWLCLWKWLFLLASLRSKGIDPSDLVQIKGRGAMVPCSLPIRWGFIYNLWLW